MMGEDKADKSTGRQGDNLPNVHVFGSKLEYLQRITQSESHLEAPGPALNPQPSH